MNNYQYDKPLRETYDVPLLAADGGAAIGKTIVGPAGMQGRVVNVSAYNVAAITVAAATVTVGPNGAASPVTLTVPISAIGVSLAIARADSTLLNQTLLAADTEVEIATGGEATAGDVALVVSIEWF